MKSEDELGPDDPVLVFIVSRHGHHTRRRVLWKVTRADAMRICSDSRTSSARYMLCWTGRDMDDPAVNEWVPDNGHHAGVLAELGVTILQEAPASAGRPRSQIPV